MRSIDPVLKTDVEKVDSQASSHRTQEYTLPAFLRCAWVHDKARLQWPPKFGRIVNAWREIEWLSVTERLRPCLLCWISPQDWEEFQRRSSHAGLSIVPLMIVRQAFPIVGRLLGASNASALSMRAVVGPSKLAKRFARAWSRADIAEVGMLLGYPQCCCTFFAEAILKRVCPESLWAEALTTPNTKCEDECLIVDGPAELNIFLRCLGIKALAHIPCSPRCSESLRIAWRFAKAGRNFGYAQEMAWLDEILRWPLEWSVLHGIVEIKTPVLKVCTNAPMNVQKFTLRRLGDSYPEDGAHGVVFPFKKSAGVPSLG